MILTVTLNAALDRDRRRAELPARPAPPRRSTRAAPPAARASTSPARCRLLGAPVIATGLARRADRGADPRAARRRAGPSRLRRGRRRLADQPRDRRSDDRRADRDQRARPRGLRRPSIERFFERLALPRRRRQLLRDRRLAAARASRRRPTPTLDRRAARRRRAGARSTPTASRCGPALRGQPVDRRPERRPRPRRSSATSSTTTTTSAMGIARAGRDGRPRGDHHPRGRRASPDLRRPGSAPSLRGRHRAARARSPRSAPATPSWPATSPPATRGRAGRGVPRLRRRLRRRVDPALRRRDASTRPRSSALVEPGHASEPVCRRSARAASPLMSGVFAVRARLARVLHCFVHLDDARSERSDLVEVEIGRGKKARRAYGFDDIAIVPSRRTRDPDDIDITWTLGPYRFELPLLASAMDGVVSPEDRGADQQARRPRRAQPRGHLVALRGRRRAARARSPQAPAETRDPADAGGLRRAGQAGADRPADRGDQGRGRRRLRLADAAEGQRVPRGRARGRPRHPRHPGHRDLGRARLVDGRAAQPQGVHRRPPGAVHRRRLRLLLDRPAPDADRRGRRPRRRRPRRRLHDARRARDRRPAGDRDRRRRGRPLAAHARDRPVLQRDRRRRHAHRRRRLQGDRLRRRRGDDRLAARPRQGGSGPRLPLGHGDLPSLAAARHPRHHPPGRHARADPARPGPARTTAPST